MTVRPRMNREQKPPLLVPHVRDRLVPPNYVRDVCKWGEKADRKRERCQCRQTDECTGEKEKEKKIQLRLKRDASFAMSVTCVQCQDNSKNPVALAR